MDKHIVAPINDEVVNDLKAGDYVYISGVIYTARDAAHLRMYEAAQKGEELPIDLSGNIIYYLGPTPAREGQVIGSAGPTTASRMDKYTPLMLSKGLKGMIGKGKRSDAVIDAMKKEGAVYFAAVGGAGALLSKCIKKAEVVAYDDLGTEAIRRLEVEDLPVIVVIDREGNNLYETAVNDYLSVDAESDGMIVAESQGTYNVGTGALKKNEMTIDDYVALPEGTRVELIDGQFYDMAAPTPIHQSIGSLIWSEFNSYIDKKKGSCVPFVAPTDVQLDRDNRTMVQPDVFVICDREKLTKARIVGAPDLVVEVLSPSNWYMDTFKKLNKYKHAGVREYWIVLPDHKKVVVYNFEKSLDPHEYTFEDAIPVAIWGGKCEVDFKKIFEKISFMYE